MLKNSLFIILFLATAAMAETLYVREDATHEGDNSGSSYANAWQGLSEVVWGTDAGEVGPGDTLYVCGLHLSTYTKSALNSWCPTVDGTSGNVITIRGDYAGDPGIIWGAAIMDQDDYVQEDGVLWSITEATTPDGQWYFEDITATSWKVMSVIDAETTITGTWTFTNGSTTVSGVGGDADPEVAVNDYISHSDQTAFFKVAVVVNDNELTLSSACTYGETGTITAFAQDGAEIIATCTDHGLVTNDVVIISGTVNYNNTYTVTKIDDDSFKFTEGWVADESPATFNEVFEDGAGETQLDDVSDGIASCKATAGSVYSDSRYLGGTKLYVHCSDGGDPTDRISANRLGWYVNCTDRDYIKYLNLDLYCNYRIIDNTSVAQNDVTWQGCKIWYGETLLGQFLGAKTNISFIDCDLAWSQNALGFTEHSPLPNTRPNGILIQGCNIHDIGVTFRNLDSEGIGTNGVYNMTIESCHFWNCGSAITAYEYENQSAMTNWIVRWNRIHDSHDTVATGRGIQFNQENDSSSAKTGNYIYGNVVYNCPNEGIRTTFVGNTVYVYNNTVYNCDVNYYFLDAVAGVEGLQIDFRNNVSLSPVTSHLYFHTNGVPTTDYLLTSDYNSFYPLDGTDFDWYDPSSSGVLTLAQWKGLVRTGCTFDGNSLSNDPLLLGAARGKLAPMDGSPLIGAGTEVGLTTDFRGNPIKDIGAITYYNYGAF